MAFALWAVQHYAFMNSYDNYSTDLPTSCSSHGGTVVSPTERLHIMNTLCYCNVSLDSGCDLSLVPILFTMFVFEEYLNRQHLPKRDRRSYCEFISSNGKTGW